MSGSEALFSTRTTAKIIGVLFLLATTSYILGTGMLESILGSPDLLQEVSLNSTRLEIGVLLKFITAAANVSIGVLLFPILKKHSEAIALGYLATRIFDGAGILTSGVLSLALVAISHHAVETGTDSTASALALGNLLVSGSETTYIVTMIALGLGAMPFCYLLYRTRLIPRPLSILGFVGYVALFAGSTLELIGVDLLMLHYIPGGLFELLLPIQLIVWGFNGQALTSAPAATDIKSEPAAVPA
jgi:hypothetical protein